VWSLESPLVLLLVFLTPLLIYKIHFSRNRGGKIRFSFRIYNAEGFDPGIGIGRVLLIVTRVLFWVGFIFLIVALAGPVRIKRQKVYLNPGLDIVIVLDESPSMLAQDFKPKHRFATAKEVIRKFIQGRENDQIGLVSFSDEAIFRVPPTVDYELLLSTLDSLEIVGFGDGTAIGMGLSLACLHLAKSGAQGRVIILLTDGENNAGEITPEVASDLAQKLKIRIYTIGIGKEGEVYMEVRDPETGQLIKGKYRGKFDEALLKKIAGLSGGRYYHASSPGTLIAIFDQIDSMEKTEKRARLKVSKTKHHLEFIFTALVLILVDFIIRKGFLREVF
jgi:Ca-activated chloride channel family protein